MHIARNPKNRKKEIQLKLRDSILKERVFDAALLIIGRVGRAFIHEEITPFFIIGTGRSGTSLLVKIMESNPSLSGFPGEANELWHPTLEPFESIVRSRLPQ